MASEQPMTPPQTDNVEENVDGHKPAIAPRQLQPQVGRTTLEQKEEAKLKAKYPNLKAGPPAMLHKRLIQKGKYFDSGDYNMARAAINNPKRPLPAQEKMLLQESIGEGIPTPKDLPPRKPSIIQSKLASGALS